MSIKETNLVAITSDDFTQADFVRVLDSEMSRKISLEQFGESIQPVLEAQGFVTANNATPNISQTRAIKTVVSDYTITEDDNVILVNTSGGDVTISLPTALSVYNVSNSTGQEFTVKKITTDSNTVTVMPDGAELIDGGSATLTGSLYPSVSFVSDGSNWWVVSS